MRPNQAKKSKRIIKKRSRYRNLRMKILPLSSRMTSQRSSLNYLSRFSNSSRRGSSYKSNRRKK